MRPPELLIKTSRCRKINRFSATIVSSAQMASYRDFIICKKSHDGLSCLSRHILDAFRKCEKKRDDKLQIPYLCGRGVTFCSFDEHEVLCAALVTLVASTCM